MVELQAARGGVILPVQAQPGSRRNGITGVHAGRLKVAVTQPPEKGKANKALIEVLSAALGVKRAQIRLMSGESAGIKKYFVEGIDAVTLGDRLEVILSLLD